MSAPAATDDVVRAARGNAPMVQPANPTSAVSGRFRIPKVRKATQVKSDFLRRVALPGRRAQVPAYIRQAAGTYTMPAYGVVVYSDSWLEDQVDKSGIYEIPTSGTPSSLHPISIDPDVVGQCGSVYADGKFFAAVPDQYMGQIIDVTYNLFNAETWQLESSVNGDPSFFATDMTYDPTSGAVYGSFINSEDQYYYFGSFNLNTSEVEEIKNYGVDYSFSGIAASPDGNLYGITSDGMFYSINKRTGDLTLLGSTGIFSDYLTSATIDAKTGKMYYVATTDAESGLYEINTATAETSLVYVLPGAENIIGLYIPSPDVAAGAPAAATSLSAEFEGASLSGKVMFTAPTLNYNNIPGTGNIEYRVMLNGETAVTGTTTYGASANADVTVPAPGQYTIALAFSNAAGQGPIATIHRYIGPDSPSDVKNVNLTYADGAFTLTWDAPTAVNGGFVNPDEIAYTITRYPDETVVARAHKGTTFTEAVAEPATRIKYSYSVTATYAGVTSGAVMSNVYALGSIVPPYNTDFNDPAVLDDFIILNANGDVTETIHGTSPKTWEWVNGAMMITYNSNMAMDDYIVLPPMKLTAGMTYSLSFDVRALMASAPEKVAVYVGKSPSVDGLDTELLAPMTVSWEDFRKREVFFVPSETGTYFFAIKGCSDADRYYLSVDNIFVSGAMEADAPAAPADLEVTAGNAGAYTASITFTAPTTTISGVALTGIDHVEIYRNDNLIHTMDATPGQSCSYVDNNPDNGNNIYSVAAFNAAGKGAVANISVYVGVYEPVSVETLSAMRDMTDKGRVYLGWDAVTSDVKGNPLSSSQVTYDIYRRVGSYTYLAATDVKGTSYVDNPVASDAPQSLIYYAIFPKTAGGEGEPTLSDMISVGAPYELPFVESFANGSLSHVFGIEETDEYNPGTWTIATGASFSDVNAADNDNGFTYYYGNTGSSALLYSGNINIGQAVNPELTFYYYDYESCKNTIDVQINAGQGFRTVRTVTLGTGEGWTKCTVALSAYMGREIQFAFVGHAVSHMVICIDNIRVGSRLENNLLISSITATPRVKAGEPVAVDVTVANDGLSMVQTFTVDLYRDGRIVATKECGPLDSDAKAVVSFSDVTNAVTPEKVGYHAVVNSAADEFESDNTSATVEVSVLQSIYPAPVALKAVSSESGVALSWNEPDFDSMPAETTVDGAEDYRSFSIGLPSSELAGDKIGDWTMVDVDGLNTYGIGQPSSDDIYMYANAAGKMAFQVFCRKDIGFENPRWDAYDGDKMFVCFAAVPANGVTGNDDWMISPRLSGNAQTISFQAKSADNRYGDEKFEVYYSTSGTAIADFVKIGGTIQTEGTDWNEYTFELPAGARHFAIRCISQDTFAFCVDDITYVSAESSTVELSLVGYNVYRDGVRLNNAPVEDQTFADTDVVPGRHSYNVTAIYTAGESMPSAAVEVDHLSGIGEVEAGDISVNVIGHTIIVDGAAGQHVDIYGVGGIAVHSAVAAGQVRVEVAPAVYVVRAAGHVVKVAVK